MWGANVKLRKLSTWKVAQEAKTLARRETGGAVAPVGPPLNGAGRLLPHVHPLAGLRRIENGVEHSLRFERVLERRALRLSALQTLNEVRHLVRKARVVADRQARHPPVRHVRVIGAVVRHVDALPPADL